MVNAVAGGTELPRYAACIQHTVLGLQGIDLRSWPGGTDGMVLSVSRDLWFSSSQHQGGDQVFTHVTRTCGLALRGPIPNINVFVTHPIQDGTGEERSTDY